MRFDVDDPNIQPFRIFDHQLQAPLYNTLRLGVIRISNPLVITPPELCNVKCYLFDDKWVCVDTITNEFPLVVWRDFQTSNRGIHEPVKCNVHVFHVMAGRVMGTELYALENHIDALLHQSA